MSSENWNIRLLDGNLAYYSFRDWCTIERSIFREEKIKYDEIN